MKGGKRLAGAAAKQYELGDGQMGGGYAGAFALTFAIGLIIFAFVLVIQIARAARGPAARAEVFDALPRFLLYVPAMMAVPGLVLLVSTFSHDFSKQLAFESGVDFGKLMTTIVNQPDIGILDVLGGPLLALALMILFIVSLLLWLIEDLVAGYALYLLTVLMPIAAALSLYPKNRPMLSRAIGMVLGLALVPVVTRFTFWLMFAVLGDVVTDASGLSIMAMLKAVVVIILSVSSPIALSMVVPMVLPNGSAAGGVGVSAGSLLQTADRGGRQAKSQLDQLTDAFKQGGDSGPDAAPMPSPKPGPGPGVGATTATGETAGVAAGAEAGSAAGPVGMAVGAALGMAFSAASQVASATHSAVLNTASMGIAASGGGYVSDPSATASGGGRVRPIRSARPGSTAQGSSDAAPEAGVPDSGPSTDSSGMAELVGDAPSGPADGGAGFDATGIVSDDPGGGDAGGGTGTQTDWEGDDGYFSAAVAADVAEDPGYGPADAYQIAAPVDEPDAGPVSPLVGVASTSPVTPVRPVPPPRQPGVAALPRRRAWVEQTSQAPQQPRAASRPPAPTPGVQPWQVRQPVLPEPPPRQRVDGPPPWKPLPDGDGGL